MAGAAGMSKLLDVDAPTAQWLSLNPDRDERGVEGPLRQQDRAGDAEAGRFGGGRLNAKANPNATPDEIATYRSGLITGALGGPAAEAAEGRGQGRAAIQGRRDRGLHPRRDEAERNRNHRQADAGRSGHLHSALINPLPTTGAAGYWMPGLAVDQKTKNMAVLDGSAQSQADRRGPDRTSRTSATGRNSTSSGKG